MIWASKNTAENRHFQLLPLERTFASCSFATKLRTAANSSAFCGFCQLKIRGHYLWGQTFVLYFVLYV
jgi:hypothetical protein